MRTPFPEVSCALRELRAGLSGFYVFLVCLFLGVAAIAGVKSLSSALVDSLRHDARYILGGDLALRTVYTPPSVEQITYLQQFGDVSTVADARAMARNADGDRTVMVEVKGVDGAYPLYGVLEHTGAGALAYVLAYTDDAWGALVEKEMLSKLGMAIGDKLHVGDSVFQVRGIITREPDRIGGTPFSIAPRLMVGMDALAETGLLQTGSQVGFDTRLRAPQVTSQETAAALADQIAAAFPDVRVRSFDRAAPRLERTIERLSFFMTLIGLTALLIGGVGVSGAVRSFIDAKLTNIATFKCLGASRGFIVRVYMLQILVLATVGIVLGLVAGAVAAQAAAGLVTARLELTDVAGFYPAALGLAALFGFLTAVCFSLWPLGRAMNVSAADLFRDAISPADGRPPRVIMAIAGVIGACLAGLAVVTAGDQKLAIWFVGGAVAAALIFGVYAAFVRFVASRLRGVFRWTELRLAIANLFRPSNITAQTVLSLGLGLTALTAIVLVEGNFTRLIGRDAAMGAPSFFFIDIQPTQKDTFLETVNRYPVTDVTMTPSLRGRITRVNGMDAEAALKDKSEEWVIRSDRGFTYMAAAPKGSEIVAGNWWPADYQGPPQISIATSVARAFGIGVGDELTVNILGVPITAKVANVREIDWSSLNMNFAVTFAPGALEGAPATWLATLRIPPENEEALQVDVAKILPNVTAVRVREALETAGTLLQSVGQAVRIAAAVMVLAGIMVLTGAIAASRQRYVHDAVVLKVVGATRGRLLAIFLLENGLLGLVTAAIALVLGVAASYGIVHFMLRLNWAFELLPALGVAVLCLVIAVLAGFAGTFRVLSGRTAGYLRNQ